MERKGALNMTGREIIILVEENFHDLEFWYPYYRLIEDGYEPIVVAPVAPRHYTGKFGTIVEAAYTPQSLSENLPRGVVIPGGWAPDKLRMSGEIVSLVVQIYRSNGVVASICHGGSLLVSAGILKGKQVTSFASIKDDMELAGAIWVDEPVVTSEKLITSRKPSDLPFFTKALLEALQKK